MGGEQIARSRYGQCNFEGLPGRLHETARPFQHGERSMAFIQMTDFRLDAECGKQPPSADPKYQLLHQAQIGPAAVKLAGNPAVRRVVCRIVAVQQVKLHPPDLNLPGTQPDRVTRQVELQPQPLPVRAAQRRDRQLSWIVVGEEGLLRSVLVDRLPEIALLVEQSHADDGNAQIAGGFELIAGDVAKPARVDRQGFAQHEFHAEIRTTA